ncbi:ORF R4 [Beet severe curly top virus - Cfh]|uniref:ORF R4 n=1 Tax=Beet severe curly top virus - Cfh TaxID=268958 RepID=Q65437_9GEMI|nr:ORF R4 [Beet severe curly top virus - Cfh]
MDLGGKLPEEVFIPAPFFDLVKKVADILFEIKLKVDHCGPHKKLAKQVSNYFCLNTLFLHVYVLINDGLSTRLVIFAIYLQYSPAIRYELLWDLSEWINFQTIIQPF